MWLYMPPNATIIPWYRSYYDANHFYSSAHLLYDNVNSGEIYFDVEWLPIAETVPEQPIPQSSTYEFLKNPIHEKWSY